MDAEAYARVPVSKISSYRMPGMRLSKELSFTFKVRVVAKPAHVPCNNSFTFFIYIYIAAS